jgi:hypothetical protein
MRDQPWRGGATVALIIAVTAWWLLIAGLITFTVPSPPLTGKKPLLAPGDVAHLSTPSQTPWLIPIDRVTYYEVDRPSLDDR